MAVAPEYVDIGSFIDQREGYRGGRPFIVGTGVTVDRVSVLHRIDAMSPDEICREMALTLPQVLAALAFYMANKDAIDSFVDTYDRETELAVAELRTREKPVSE